MDHSHSQTRPADILHGSILGASTTVSYSAAEKEVVKMTKNGPRLPLTFFECRVLSSVNLLTYVLVLLLSVQGPTRSRVSNPQRIYRLKF